MSNYLARIREALIQAFLHDVVNTAKAAAYSGMLMFFPALLVITTLVAQVEEGPSLVGETRTVLEQFLPADTLDLVQSSILAHQFHSGQLILSATCLSLFAGLGVMLSLMEGFRRAYRLPPESWTFWGRRARALLLVFIVLIPLSLASILIVFGHQIEHWMIGRSGHRAAPISHPVLAHGSLGSQLFRHRGRSQCSLSFRHAQDRALAAGGSRGNRGHHHLVPGHARVRLVRHQRGQLHAALRIVRRWNRDSRVALHHFVQRSAWRGAERRSLLGSSESNRGRFDTRAGSPFPLASTQFCRPGFIQIFQTVFPPCSTDTASCGNSAARPVTIDSATSPCSL